MLAFAAKIANLKPRFQPQNKVFVPHDLTVAPKRVAPSSGGDGFLRLLRLACFLIFFALIPGSLALCATELPACRVYNRRARAAKKNIHDSDTSDETPDIRQSDHGVSHPINGVAVELYSLFRVLQGSTVFDFIAAYMQYRGAEGQTEVQR